MGKFKDTGYGLIISNYSLIIFGLSEPTNLMK